MHMASELSKALKSRISYGGLKDKRAFAIQYVTPTSRRGASPVRVEGERFTAERVGYLPRPFSRALVEGNSFVVTLRNCCPDIEARVAEAMGAAAERRVPNYYGLQRFGILGSGTHRVGRAIVMGEFEAAVTTLLLDGGDPSGEGAAAREAFMAGRYAELAETIPRGRDVERSVARELARHPKNWVKALRAVPVRLRRFYVQAFQSLLFNKTLSRALAEGEDISHYLPGDNWAEPSEGGLRLSPVRGVRDPPVTDAVPMVQVAGYAYRDYGSRFDRCLGEVIREDGVNPGSFYVHGMEEVSAEGGFRRPHLASAGRSWRIEGSSAVLGFVLAKGAYATVLLREVVKPEDPAAAGLG